MTADRAELLTGITQRMTFVVEQRGELMLKVPYGQDPYSVIGKYIRDHITAIEDIIAVIKINEVETNQLFMVNMNEENYFIWENDWYEGEKDVALIDFFPVSEAINPSTQPERKTGHWIPVTNGRGGYQCDRCGSYAPSYQSGAEWLSNFCPECNADMRGEADGQK